MPSTPEERQTIGLWPATAVVIGSIIGSGIFMKPATMAAQIEHPVWLALTWIIAGLFSLFGAFIFAEMGTLLPRTGGLYVYFQHMFGDFVAFLYGWAAFAVINSASVSAISFVCAQYADYFLHLPRLPAVVEQSWIIHLPYLGNLYPLQNLGVKALAILLVLGLTLLNYRTVKGSSGLQVISTFIKVAVIVLLVAGIFLSGKGAPANFVESGPGGGLLSGIIPALTGAFMAYDGWINVTFISGEMKMPQRNIPRSLITGLLICICTYLLVNQAYLYVLPVDVMAHSPLVAADAIAVAWGGTGSTVIAALIVICTFGAVNGNTMSISRVTYAMGKDGLFFKWTGKTHPRFHTPGNALWLHGAWSSILVLSGSFDMLADMFTFVAWVAYLLGAIGFFVLRRKTRGTMRPYRCWGYPIIPVLFIGFAAFYVISTVWNDIVLYQAGKTPLINSLLGLLLTASGIPLYLYFKRERAVKK